MGVKVGFIMVVVALAIIGALRFRGLAHIHDDSINAIAHYSSTDEGDEGVLQQLQAHGSNLKKPTDIVNYLYIPKLADADNIVDHLSRGGYQVELREPLGRLPDGTVESRYSVLLHITEVPSIENIRKMRNLMNQLASRFNGEYDGWEAAIQH